MVLLLRSFFSCCNALIRNESEAKLENLDQKIKQLFKEIMQHCRLERKLQKGGTVRELASQLEVTENFVSSIENGREIPSLGLFLKYLLINNFDIEPLKNLRIASRGSGSKGNRKKTELLNKIYKLDDEEVSFMVEQAKMAEIFKVRSRKRKTRS